MTSWYTKMNLNVFYHAYGVIVGSNLQIWWQIVWENLPLVNPIAFLLILTILSAIRVIFVELR